MTVWLLTVLSKAMVKVKGVLKHSCGSSSTNRTWVLVDIYIKLHKLHTGRLPML